MQSNKLFEENYYFVARYNMSHLNKTIYYHKD